MDLLYVLAAGLILLVALAAGEAAYPRSKVSEISLPKRHDHPPQAGRLPEAD
jgi:hypothetical protein